MKKVITYGTFDTLHFGHVRLLRRARALGDYLVVGLSTDAFNSEKGKVSHLSYAERKECLEAIRFVDLVIPEECWEQKPADIEHHGIDIFAMGSDWKGQFDELKSLAEVVYLQRTPEISTTVIKSTIKAATVETG